MRVSLQWLKELVSADAGAFEPAVLAERLSVAGFEVDAIDDLSQQAAGVVVGFVQERQPHPDAAKLSVCQVDVGAAEPLQIVCGAANVRDGIHVPVALVGATLPAVNLTIKPAELRGVASSGMICSLSELGLSDSSDGIAVLDALLAEVPPLGSAVAGCFGLDDTVLELAITANRPDGLSMLGIAREVAALVGGGTTVPQAPAVPAAALPVSTTDQQAIEQGGLFSMTELSGVQVRPSPAWLQQRLEKAGVRAINNVVDITNLVMLETGQPLHAFDRERLAAGSGGQADPAALGLRPGQPDEQFTTLDGETRSLSAEALVVTYADRPIALAGVMGGADTAVDASTTSIWLEAAVFAPQAVRRSARSVGLRSEASSRFEKGLPTEATLAAADRAVALLQSLAGASVGPRWLHGRTAQDRPPLLLRRDALHNLLGPVIEPSEPNETMDLDDGAIEQTLTAIGCELTPCDDDEGWQVQVPPQRAIDLRREVDLIEEVARLVGYDRFASHLPDPLEPGGLTPAQQAERRLRRALVAAGLQETCSFSLVPEADSRLPLANPLLADYGHLRDQLHSELLAAAQRNLQSGQDGFWAFEIGTVFAPAGAAESRTVLAAVVCGSRRSELWSSSGKAHPLTYHQARGVLQGPLNALAVPVEDRLLKPQDPLHPGRSAELVIEGRPAGWFGQLHPAQAAELDLPETTYLLELDLAALLTAATRAARWQPTFQPFATVPASERDLAVLVPAATRSAELLGVMRKAGRPLLEKVELIDTYSSEQLGSGVCSQAFRLRYRDPKRTLTDADVETAHGKVRAALAARSDVQLRS
ncbi:MAG: phenylalanine--tRNA ligase subunit beta [Cyanobacteria bacterium K_DeepCast_35m_m2_023]|nr:phenylalanine--tRNA ligase subunit beta [Cyanobacteria bacterium K_DeepCast_35m_m2_023]